MRLIVIVAAVLIYATTCIAENRPQLKNPRPEVTKSIRGKARELYNQLMSMRKEPDFINYGFDGFGHSKNWEKYVKWDKASYSLQQKCTGESEKISNPVDRMQSELSELCIATNYLHQAGNHYGRNHGENDKFTKEVLPKIRSALKIK